MPGSCRFCLRGSGLPPPTYSPVAHTAPRARLDILTQLLRQNRTQASRQLITHRIFLLRRKGIDRALDRLRRTARVQRGQHQMAGFRRRQRGRIVSLSRSSPSRITSGSSRSAAQGLGKGRAVQAYLPLLDQATFTLVHKLHRIFRSEYARPSGD